MIDVIKREPALASGLVQAVLALVVSFGIGLSPEQIGSIMALTGIVVAVFTRLAVTPNSAVVAKVDPTSSTGVVAGSAAPQSNGVAVEVVTADTPTV